MPALINIRHERFSQELARGKSASEAAEAAGFTLRACNRPVAFYVYLLADPRDGSVFYVGKGKGRRHAAHWAAMLKGRVQNPKKHERLADIHRYGLRVDEWCFAEGLSEKAAYVLEQALIRSIGFSRLTNMLPGITSPEARGLAQAKDHLSRIRPFCAWKMLTQPSPLYERYYWDVIAGLKGIVRDAEKRLAA